MKTIKGLAFHVHHNILFEHCYDYKERVYAIKRRKPKNEQKIRLRLFKMLSKEAIAELPKNILKADVEFDKAMAELDKADAELYKAMAEFDKARAELYKAGNKWDEKESFHTKHCGCKEWNGKEIIFKN